MIASAELRAAKDLIRADRKAKKAARPKPVQPIAAGQRKPRLRLPLYLAWIRCLPCAAAVQGPCYGPVQAAHLRYSDGARRNPGMQAKPDDNFTTPLCASHHAMQHGAAERTFWRLARIEPADLTRDLYAAFLAGEDGAAVVRRYADEARGERRGEPA